MPTKTYYNLPDDKKERIFNAGVLELSYHDLFDASVNTIVRIANISKGSFYQYFEDKDEFYWYIVTEVIFGTVEKYETLLLKHEGDFLQTEEELFNSLLDLFDDTKYRNLLANVYKRSYMELKSRISNRASTIYFDMYDVLMKFGFKGYNIRSKEDFLISFNMVRNISNHTIMTMIVDNLSKNDTKALYKRQIEYLSNGLKKRGWF
jgi:AcrR family transcriptional regulator